MPSADKSKVVKAHVQKVTHSYSINYPDHFPREGDPHYIDFKHFHDKNKATAKCVFGEKERYGDYSECDLTHPLELHHAHIEFAMQNGVDLALLEKDYPGVSNPDEVGAWVESGANFEWRCVRHHRSHAGVHLVTVADDAAARYIRNLFA